MVATQTIEAIGSVDKILADPALALTPAAGAARRLGRCVAAAGLRPTYS